MHKFLRILSSLFFILFLTYSEFSYSKLISEESSNLLEDKKKSSIFNLFFKDLNHTIANLFPSTDDSNINNQRNYIDIISDYKIRNDDIFEAKGNVIVNYNESKLYADYFIYNFVTKKLEIKGNIIFRKGDQFFKASSIYYDLNNKKGNLLDIYGNINFKDIDKILLKDTQNDLSKKINKDIKIQSINSLGFEREQKSADSLAFKNLYADIKNIDNWRFQTEKMELSENQLFSKKIYLTTDPLDPVQLKIISKDFKVKKEKEKVNIYTKWNTLVLEDKLKFPLGKQSIVDSNDESGWGIGYDKKEKDGLFVKRNYKSKDLTENLNFKLSNYFFLQRAIINKSESFPIKNSAVGAQNSETDTNLYDLFGIDATLTGKISNWDVNLASEINSLSLDRFYNNLKLKGELSKDIDFFNIENVNLGIYGSFRNKVWNINSGEFEVYSSYGLKLFKENNFSENNVNKYYAAGLSIGKYKAISKPISDLKELWRASLYARKQNIYPLIKFSKQLETYNNYKFKPQNLSPGIDWISDFRLYSSIYSDNSSQNVFYFRQGPEMKFVNYDRYFLYFTKISLIAEQVFRFGESPFYFEY